MTSVAEGRRSRGQLHDDVKRITDVFVTDAASLGLKDGEALTPHRIVKALIQTDSLDTPPSTGAVSNVLKNWREIGFAEIAEGPTAFVDYTEGGRDQGMNAMREAAKKGRRDAKAGTATEAVPVTEEDTVPAEPGHVVDSSEFTLSQDELDERAPYTDSAVHVSQFYPEPESLG